MKYTLIVGIEIDEPLNIVQSKIADPKDKEPFEANKELALRIAKGFKEIYDLKIDSIYNINFKVRDYQ